MAKCGKFFTGWFIHIVVLNSFHERFSLCICVNHGTLLINGEVIVNPNSILGICGLWFRCDTLAILDGRRGETESKGNNLHMIVRASTSLEIRDGDV
jgi:hypothetical protein